MIKKSYFKYYIGKNYKYMRQQKEIYNVSEKCLDKELESP